MIDFVYLGMLFDTYKELLTKKEVEVYSLYYEENLTLQEIADNKCVSKSYIGSIIKKTTKKLEEFESKLHIYETKHKLSDILEYKDIDEIKKEIRNLI